MSFNSSMERVKPTESIKPEKPEKTKVESSMKTTDSTSNWSKVFESKDSVKNFLQNNFSANEAASWPNKPGWMKEGKESRENSRPTPRDSEIKAKEIYGGKEQVSYLNRKEVPYGTPGSTRPDLVRIVNKKTEAIEVKNYEFSKPDRIEALTKELQRQVGERAKNLPKDSTQRIVLDPRGQNISNQDMGNIKNKIQDACKDSYPNIPIDVLKN